ncbi:hypothetical protein OPV22_022672 [Ensete ventricosum]|uniref:Uncharacterized protein n=1 Tax=Ensete ventricosum TaxID=4639 RepID=A0AAV8QT14_ENSVE|nr:hypothetical protein OPV22_022672 [Ensete ventricosum]
MRRGVVPRTWKPDGDGCVVEDDKPKVQSDLNSVLPPPLLLLLLPPYLTLPLLPSSAKLCHCCLSEERRGS